MEHRNLDQVERDFYSARQAYTQAEQEEVTEEGDLRPNSQEASWVWSLSGGAVKGSTLIETAHPSQAP